MTDWKNRIIGHGTAPAEEFIANPDNPRRHPQKQRDAMKGSLDALGWIAPVIVNRRTGYLIDGHERVMQALTDNRDVPFIEVDLSEDEEKLALGSFDWITSLATYDTDTLSQLMQDIHTDSVELQAMFSEMAESVGITPPDFMPVDESELPRLDELDPKMVTCPHCNHEFNLRDTDG